MIDLNNWRNFIPELSQKEVEIPHFDRASLRETGCLLYTSPSPRDTR